MLTEQLAEAREGRQSLRTQRPAFLCLRPAKLKANGQNHSAGMVSWVGCSALGLLGSWQLSLSTLRLGFSESAGLDCQRPIGHP